MPSHHFHTMKPREITAYLVGTYTTTKTQEGEIYAIVDDNYQHIASVAIAHKKYRDIDLAISKESTPFDSMRNHLTKLFDDCYGRNNYNVSCKGEMPSGLALNVRKPIYHGYCMFDPKFRGVRVHGSAFPSIIVDWI